MVGQRSAVRDVASSRERRPHGRRPEGGEVVGAVVAAPVDEEGRGAGDAAEVGALDVLGDSVGAGVLAQMVGEPLDVEPELVGVANEVRGSQRVLMLEQQVVHRPERALGGGGLGGLGGELGVGVHVAQGQVPPDVPHVGEVAQQLAHRRFRPAAVRTLEVAVLHHGDGRIEWAADVIPVGIDVVGEIDQRLLAAQQRRDPSLLR